MQKFNDLYVRLGLMDEQRNLLLLHSHCRHRDICWKGIQQRIPAKYGYISRPWIGPNYPTHRIVFIGINMNGFGGGDANLSLFQLAISEMKAGTRRVLKQPNYSGTELYYKVACYTSAILTLIGEGSGQISLDVDPSPQSVASCLEYVAFTNYVKCSPIPEDGDRSKPSQGMWENCGKHVLESELSILSPEIVVLLGVSSNRYYFNRYIPSRSCLTWSKKDSVYIGEQSDDSNTKFIAVPHPAYLKAKVGDVVKSLEVCSEYIRAK